MRVRQAMRRLEQSPVPVSIAGMADELGVSHKHLIHEFRAMVGLTPKVYGRIRRFQRVLHRIHQEGKMEWADVACACGYYDQSHFVREFKEFAGMNPSDFLSHTAGDPKFIPLDEEG